MSTDDDGMDEGAGPQRLLVAVDDGPGGALALELAVSLTSGRRAKVTIAGVVPYPDAPAPASEVGIQGMPVLPYDALQAAQQRVRDRLEALAARLPGRLEVRTSVSTGPAGNAIADLIELGRYDMALLPWHGTGTVDHLLHDHAAKHVLTHARIPVVLVPTAPVPVGAGPG